MDKVKYLNNIIAFVGFIILNFICWRVFFAPSNGVFKLFTPMYGLSLIATLLFAVLVIVMIFQLHNNKNIISGIWLTVFTLVIFAILYYVVFWNLIGKFGIAYFSPYSLIEAGGTGAEIWNARENSSLAILYTMTSFIFIAYIWNFGFENFPWEQNSKMVQGISKVFAISFFGTFLYIILFHPHVTALFVPKQIYAGVEPWWSNFAMTQSALFHLAWIFPGILLLDLISNSFEGYPLNSIKNKYIKLVVTIAITLVFGFIFMYIAEAVMNYFWYEPFTGGNYTDDPRFRHVHVAEISLFATTSALIIKTYFNNIINKENKWLNFGTRLISIAVLTALIYMFYYSQSIGPWYMDRVSGIGNIDETSLCWSIMSIVLILIHDKFFKAYPVNSLKRED